MWSLGVGWNRKIREWKKRKFILTRVPTINVTWSKAIMALSLQNLLEVQLLRSLQQTTRQVPSLLYQKVTPNRWYQTATETAVYNLQSKRPHTYVLAVMRRSFPRSEETPFSFLAKESRVFWNPASVHTSRRILMQCKAKVGLRGSSHISNFAFSLLFRHCEDRTPRRIRRKVRVFFRNTVQWSRKRVPQQTFPWRHCEAVYLRH